ncbi:hypothetical protein GOV09_02490 [Candidatus Woesearchaeota archaeon]|nr:hypothetical protein [Candidatus Woesearchaeota archaeon]
MINMKKIIIIIGLVLVLVVAGIFLISELTPKPTREKVFFTDNPSDWVYESPTDPAEVVVDTYLATEGSLKTLKSQQDYFTSEGLTSFFYQGMYKGEEFDSEYLPADFFNKTRGMGLSEKRALADELVAMSIGHEFDPHDGIINGFVLAREEEGRFVFYIFVDEDWKRELEFTNILWANDFRGKISQRPFDFSSGQNGVYIDKIENIGWYEASARRGGIVIGEISQSSLVALMRGDEQDITYMMVR